MMTGFINKRMYQMLKIIRWIFANLTKADDKATGKVPNLQTPAYMSEVEDNLDRYFNLRIERRNSHIPVLRHDQFDRDLASTRNAGSVNRRRNADRDTMKLRDT
jgi:hypothetical protein